MKKPQTRQSDSLPQRDRFIEMACKLGSGEDQSAFKAKLAVIAWQKSVGLTNKEKKDDGE